MSQIQPPDPAAEADRAAVDNLLRCWVRETGVERPADDVLRLELPASGTAVEAPVRYWSPVGWHRFGPARLPSCRLYTTASPRADASYIVRRL
ncbi:iron transporter, partial [Streptomyces sp. Act-28]